MDALSNNKEQIALSRVSRHCMCSFLSILIHRIVIEFVKAGRNDLLMFANKTRFD